MRLIRLNATFTKQRGDTIVEVLLALTVIALIIGGSSVLANRSSRNLQAAQENSSGQKIAQAQLEYLRDYVSSEAMVGKISDNSIMSSVNGFCMAPASSAPNSPIVPTASTSTACSLVTGVATPDISRNNVRIYITSSADGEYVVRTSVRWDGLTVTTQNVDLDYRIYDQVGAAYIGDGTTCSGDQIPSGGTCVDASPSVRVTVLKIPPRAVTNGDGSAGQGTPGCGDPATEVKSGVRIDLFQQNGSEEYNQTTNSSGNALFSNLAKNGGYKTQITVPSTYLLCGQVEKPISLPTGQPNPRLVEYRIYPKCDTEQRRNYLGYYGDYLGTYSDYLGYYSDYLGTYSDPYTVYWWTHTGEDRRRTGLPANTFETNENGARIQYRWRGDLGHTSAGWFYERWTEVSGTAWGPPYDHYTAPYNHYTEPYAHYTGSYDHYTGYYTAYKCEG